MTTFDKIKHHSEGLNNELANLSVLVGNLEIKDKEHKDFETKRILWEKQAAEREAKILTNTHANEEQKRNNEQDRLQIDAKQNKLQSEWQRMTEDREVLDRDKDEIAREKLRLKNRQDELAQKELQANEKLEKSQTLDEMNQKKQEALDEMNKKLALKKQITDEKARKIDAMYAEVE